VFLSNRIPGMSVHWRGSRYRLAADGSLLSDQWEARAGGWERLARPSSTRNWPTSGSLALPHPPRYFPARQYGW